jgi:hypothetical protein
VKNAIGSIRQGDVLLKPSTIPTAAKRVSVRPIALGERTGHHHSLMTNVETPIEDLVEMYEKDGKLFVRVLGEPDSVSLVHQQHKAHTIPAGDFVYVPQVENSDWGNQRVLD